MRRLLYRLRGLAAFTLMGAAAGALLGILWALRAHFFVPQSVGYPTLQPLLLFWGTIFGMVGATAGLGFGGLLTASSGRLTLEEVGSKRVAILGGFAGGAAPLLIATLLMGQLPWLGLALPAVLIGAGVGALTSFGVLRLARGGAQALPAHEQSSRPVNKTSPPSWPPS